MNILHSQHEAAGIVARPHTATPLWQGERLDVGYAIDVLHPRALGDGTPAEFLEDPDPEDDL